MVNHMEIYVNGNTNSHELSINFGRRVGHVPLEQTKRAALGGRLLFYNRTGRMSISEAFLFAWMGFFLNEVSRRSQFGSCRRRSLSVYACRSSTFRRK